MKLLYAGLSLLCFTFLFSCGSSDSSQEQEVVVAPPPPAPEVDSVALQLTHQQELLASGDSAARQSIARLRQLSALLQDSISNTELPAQLQEEFIWAYRSRLHEVGQARQALENWLQRQQDPQPDSLSGQDKIDWMQQELDDLEALLLQARVARREARESLQEASEAVQAVEEPEQEVEQQQL
jgi:hypothetical protein